MADNLSTSIKNLNTLLGNQLAEGSGGGGAEPLIVNKVNAGTDLDPVVTLDHTWQEIWDAYIHGNAVLIKESEYAADLVILMQGGGEFGYIVGTRSARFSSDEPNGYPVEN